ncbi:uncharacterized protein CIMG_13736 [Coccidioides immitis RS]|uniref:uncharacterized protein n=1 Tax=Coccidioides immitis (strain RS) TaxID=246410 RepID=UPI00027D160C|nr:uncharacterized protein CIMG_13736 [Coccidioides immitis RS]EAS32702.3 hypothetical protein CIMG_13736 [Coccidioides immitis RS]
MGTDGDDDDDVGCCGGVGAALVSSKWTATRARAHTRERDEERDEEIDRRQQMPERKRQQNGCLLFWGDLTMRSEREKVSLESSSRLPVRRDSSVTRPGLLRDLRQKYPRQFESSLRKTWRKRVTARTPRARPIPAKSGAVRGRGQSAGVNLGNVSIRHTPVEQQQLAERLFDIIARIVYRSRWQAEVDSYLKGGARSTRTSFVLLEQYEKQLITRGGSS